MDLDGPVDPTYVRTQQQITNVCKVCGCNNLSRSRSEHLQECQKQKEMEDFEPMATVIAIVIVLIIVVICIAAQ